MSPVDRPPADRPHWRALEIGPGGVPAEQVRPIGPAAPGHRPVPDDEVPPAWRHWMADNPLRAADATKVAVADCLSSTGQRIGTVVACDSDAADFAVVGRYGDSADASDCSATPSDVAVIMSGPTVLCLDYVAVVGDCIFAGAHAAGVGKVSCDSTSPGVYRVDKVLRNSIDPGGCPSGTTQTLVHLHNSEVICLGHT